MLKMYSVKIYNRPNKTMCRSRTITLLEATMDGLVNHDLLSSI